MTDAFVVGTSHPTPPTSLRWAEARSSETRGASRVMVEFRALGPIEATVAGRPVNLGAPKQRALLALLVSRVGQPVALNVLMEALWAAHPPPSAVASLQAYIANLRRLLEPERTPRAPATVLRTCPLGYLLEAGVVRIDVGRFGQHATAGLQAWDREEPRQALREFEAGLALWRGAAYPEVAGTPCVMPELARLEELRLLVAEMRCAALLAVGAHEMAVAELAAFTKANPLREYGCELLSLALYRAGRQADAMEVMRITQKRLAEELGLDPRPALQHLKHEILNQAPTLDWRPLPPVTAGTAGMAVATSNASGTTDSARSPDTAEESFVGRDAALRQLTEALAAVETGSGRVVVVSGELGIGKTRLLRLFAESARVPVLWGASPGHVAAPPLWLWERVLRAASASFPQCPVPAPVAELLNGAVGHPADSPDPAGITLRRFEAIVQYLVGVSRVAPLVVLVDDLHRADSSSVRLLEHLAESVPASRLLLVASYRSDAASVLADTLATLARGAVTRIELAGLGYQDTHDLARALLRREVGKRTIDGLYARTEGNPFFLRELIKLLTSQQRLDDPHRAPVPASVREVALWCVARLPGPVGEILSVAAIAGRHFDIEIVADVMSIGVDAALERLDAAIASGLVQEDQQRLGWFRFTHALVAEALYESTGRLRRVRLHRRIGAVAGREWAPETEIAQHDLLIADAVTPVHAGLLAKVPRTSPYHEPAAAFICSEVA